MMRIEYVFIQTDRNFPAYLNLFTISLRTYTDPSTPSMPHWVSRPKNTLQQYNVCSGFPLGSPGRLYNWFQSCEWELMDSFAMALVDMFINVFPYFQVFYWWLFAFSAHNIETIFNQFWNKYASLKKKLKKHQFKLGNIGLSEHFKSSSSKFTKFHAKFDANVFLEFFSHYKNFRNITNQYENLHNNWTQ